MPGMNRKGPSGNGPLTGRQQGLCRQNGSKAVVQPEQERPAGQEQNQATDEGRMAGQGLGQGSGRGQGRGLGRSGRGGGQRRSGRR